MLKRLIFASHIFLGLAFFACKPSQSLVQSTFHPPEMNEARAFIKSMTDSLEQNMRGIFLKRKIQLSRKDTIVIAAVGDMMLGTNYPLDSYLPPNEGKDLLKNVQDELMAADITFGNLEGVVLNNGGDPKYCRDTLKCYIFRMPEYLISRVAEAGFDVLSTANNHAGDFGDPGRRNTVRVLDSLDIHHAGLLLQPFTTFEREGVRYGFTAFSPNNGTQSIHDIQAAKLIVKRLAALNDIVIVSFHGGAEGKEHEHISRKTEKFYGENRGNVYQFAHEMIDAGADMVFGHGPHVTRAIEVYKNRFIAYSLGNFCTYARFNLRGPNGIAPIAKIKVDRSGKFLEGQIIPVKQVGAGIPLIDKNKKVIYKIQELTRKDFPESKIHVDDNGIIEYIDHEI
jgi:poly-gamma-glutamate capsule biosynthesis protein CapA/YwtB (metallophosphatase superfamily)